MRFIGYKKFSVLKSLMVLGFLAVILTSCASIPKYPKVPVNSDASQMAQIKLISVNEFNEKFGGTDFELHFFIIPHFRDEAGISFDKKFMVKVEGEWESSNGKFFGRRYKFNDKSVFNVPAGTYEVCAHKLIRKGVLKRCYKDGKFTFEPGKKYEMYVYYRTETEVYAVHRGTLYKYRWYLGIQGIKKVDEFKPNNMFTEK